MKHQEMIVEYLKHNLQFDENLCNCVLKAIDEHNDLILCSLLEHEHYFKVKEFAKNFPIQTKQLKQISQKFAHKNYENSQKMAEIEKNSCSAVTYTLKGSIEENFSKILDAISANPIVLIKGETGIGKTTKLPLLLMEKYKKIICTQPRRIAATSVAKRAADIFGCKLGQEIGYSIRFKSKRSAKTRLLYATDGIFINEIINNGGLVNCNYDLIIIDEAHERTINIDILLSYLRIHIGDKRLIIMSATLEDNKLMQFFNCPLISLEAKSFLVEIIYTEYPVKDYLCMIVEMAVKIAASSTDGHILIFMSGQKEIEDTVEKLNLVFTGTNFVVLPLYSQMPEEEQSKVFIKHNRKIICATNVAETSITIDNVAFVIDTGYVKVSRINENMIYSLEQTRISKNQARQRAGRAGRTCEGFVYRLYTLDEFNSMEDNSEPAMLKEYFADAIFFLLNFKIKNIYDFEFIDKPPSKLIDKYLNEFYALKLIDENLNMTAFGKQIVKFPVNYRMGVMLYHSYKNGCLNKISTICAFLENLPVFERVPQHLMKKAKETISKNFRRGNGNIYMFLSIYEQWQKKNYDRDFLIKNFLRIKAVETIKQIKEQLVSMFKSLKTQDTNENILNSICSGYFMCSAQKTKGIYSTIYDSLKARIHFSDPLQSEYPKFIIFFEIFQDQNKIYLCNCIEVDSAYLERAVNHTST